MYRRDTAGGRFRLLHRARLKQRHRQPGGSPAEVIRRGSIYWTNLLFGVEYLQ